MIKNNRNNEQIYGRNDMIMLDPNNKIYGSLGLADRYVMKTEEGTKLTLSNPKLGSFDDVLTEFNIYGMSKQGSTTGANLIDIDNMLNECLVKNADDTYSILKTETNRFSKSFPINLKAGTVVRFDADVIEYNGTYNNKLQCNFGSDTITEGHTITLREDITKVTIYQDGSNDVGTYTKFKNAILSVGKAKVPYEPYTGGKPSPSPDYPQEIKSVVNPTVKVTNEDGLKVQSVTLNNITLNAIPVSSGGNVTIDGQQWVCDEVDLERGVKVQRVKVLDVRNEILFLKGISEHYWYVSIDLHDCSLNGTVFKSYESVMCQKFQVVSQQNEVKYSYPIVAPYGHIGSTELRFRAPEVLYATIEDFQQTIVGAKVYYPLATAIEIPLTNTEIAAFNALTTYHPTTIVENNYNTWMKATYKSIESV